MTEKTEAWIKVSDSSNIRAYAYDAQANRLSIEFSGGTRYDYDCVTPNLIEGLKAAPSKGKYFYENIRAKFNGTRRKDHG